MQILPGGFYLNSDDIRTGFSFLGLPPLDPNCETAFMHVFCLAGIPPCSNRTNLLLPVCEDSCSAFNRLVEQGNCDSIIETAEQFLFAPTTLEVFRPVFKLLTDFDCRNSSTYYFSNEETLDSEMCTGLLSRQQTGKFVLLFC